MSGLSYTTTVIVPGLNVPFQLLAPNPLRRRALILINGAVLFDCSPASLISGESGMYTDASENPMFALTTTSAVYMMLTSGSAVRVWEEIAY